MSRSRRLTTIAILPLVAALAACNMPSSEPAAEPTEAPTVVPTPPPDPEGDRDSCLDGDWWSYTHDVDILLATLAPVPNMHVPDGTLVMFFNADGTYEYQGNITLRLDMNPAEDQYIETQAFFTTSGPYSTQDDSMLHLDLSNSRTEILRMEAHKNGETYSADGLMPSVDIFPPGSAPYRCTGDRLEIDTQGPYGPATMFFYRP